MTTQGKRLADLTAYIRANRLVDKYNRRMINCDAYLREITGKPIVSWFELSMLIRNEEHL